MDAIDAAAVNEDFAVGVGRLQHGDAGGIELDRDAVGALDLGEEIRSERGHDQLEHRPQRPILVQAGDPIAVALEGLPQRVFLLPPKIAIGSRRESRCVELDQQANGDRIVEQDVAHEGSGERRLEEDFL